MGCESTDPKSEQKTEPSALSATTCNGSGDAGCAIYAGALLLFSAAATPTSTTLKRSRSQSLFGRCEVLLVDESSTSRPLPKPCSQVLIKIRQGGVDVRDAWIDEFEFEIGHLKPGKYDLEAYSETYDARAKLNQVSTGTYLRLEIRLPKR